METDRPRPSRSANSSWRGCWSPARGATATEIKKALEPADSVIAGPEPRGRATEPGLGRPGDGRSGRPDPQGKAERAGR